jgi:hypothetical protein
MHQSDSVIEYLGQLISNFIVTEKTVDIKRSQICFAGDVQEFRELIVRGVEASLELVSHDDIFVIAIAKQRRNVQAEGLPLLSDDEELPVRMKLAS